jgi:hypothetical protein
MRPEPFALAAVVCVVVGGLAFVRVPRPLEAALYLAVAVVLAGFAAGIAVGLLDPPVPDVDYTAAGGVPIVLAFAALVAFGGRPVGGYVTAVFGGLGALLVGLDTGRNRAD